MSAIAPTTRAVLACITRLYREQGYGVSMRDLVAGVPLSSTSVAQYHVRKLVARGLVTQEPGIARSLRPVEER